MPDCGSSGFRDGRAGRCEQRDHNRPADGPPTYVGADCLHVATISLGTATLMGAPFWARQQPAEGRTLAKRFQMAEVAYRAPKRINPRSAVLQLLREHHNDGGGAADIGQRVHVPVGRHAAAVGGSRASRRSRRPRRCHRRRTPRGARPQPALVGLTLVLACSRVDGSQR